MLITNQRIVISVGILSRFRSSVDDDLMISLIGPPNGGKTTFVRYLESGEPILEDIGPTLGLEYRSAPKAVEMLNLKIIDVGGHEVYQQTFWELAIERADAVLFVIDATITKKDQPIIYEMMIRQFDYAIDIVPEFKPLLFLLNKQDLVEMNPMSPQEAIRLFDPDKIKGRSIEFLPTSAKYGDGVVEAIEFLISVYQQKHNV